MRTLLAVLLCALPLCSQDFANYEIVLAAGGYTFAEGPAWSREAYLVFSDVPEMKIWKVSGQSERPELFRESPGRAMGNAFDSKGRLYTCETGERRITRTDRKGRVTVLLDQWEGKRLNATNDIVVREDGNVYFTDPAFGSHEETRELDFNGVFRIDPKGAAELIAKPKSRPNGVGLSPGGKLLYVANSDERRLYAYDLDKKGAASGERILIKGIDGPPNGLTVDEKGNIYIAANRLAVYSPRGNSSIRSNLPNVLPTAPLAERSCRRSLSLSGHRSSPCVISA